MMSYLETYHPEIIPVLINLRARSKPFHAKYLFTDLILKEVSCSSWWKTVDPDNRFLSAEVVNFICQLQTAVVSSASIEGIFSRFGLVHSKLRNQLGIAKAGKLVFLHKVFNENLENIDSDE